MIDPMENEEWRTITEASDYAVSGTGKVMRVRGDWQGKYAGLILKPSVGRGGYRWHVLSSPKGKITRKVHRLVCAAFNGPCPPDKTLCAHRNGDTSINTPANLYWGTALENSADRERHGTVARGENSGAARHPEKIPCGDDHWSRKNPERVLRGDDHPSRRHPERVPLGSARNNSKVTEDIARAIRAEPKVHGSGKRLALKYGVTMGLITSIRNGRSWRHA